MVKIDRERLVIAGYQYHPHSGATFIIGYAPGAPRLGENDTSPVALQDGYIVGWIPPGRRNVEQYQIFNSYHYAYTHFIRQKDNTPPAEGPFVRDYQRQKVYEWQWKNIRGYFKRVSQKNAEKLVQSISDEFNLRAPDLRFRDDRYHDYCYFEAERHEIGGHKSLRNIGNLVHECAHMVDIHAERNIFSCHGPSFVEILIRLAAKHIPGNDEKKLRESARKAGLLGLPPEIHYAPPSCNPLTTPSGP